MIALIGLVAAFLLASRLSGRTGDFLGTWITSTTAADITGFILVFIIVMIVAGIIGALIRKLVDMAALTATDRSLGMLFGAARGILMISICFLVYTSYTKPNAPWLKASLLAPYAIKLGDLLGHAIPEGYPFSRQGTAQAPSLKHAATAVSNAIPLADKEALKEILENSNQ